jgi:DNA-binding MarR family transcriptional regulator
MSKKIEEMDITYSQLMVLRVINNEPGITAKEILMIMDSDKATLSGIITRLEKADFIYRVKNDKDGRVRNIYLAEGSEDVCNKVTILEENCMSDIANGLSPDEMNEFNRLMDKIIENQMSKIQGL